MALEMSWRQEAWLTSSLPQHWRRPLLHLGLAWAVIGLLLASTLGDMASQYWDSSTYNHILFVPLIIGWLVKLRVRQLAPLQPKAWWPGLIAIAAALFLWLLGDMSGLAVATHLAAVLALQSAVLTVLGPRIAYAVLFPLTYMLFLVPIGDELVPALQMITADLTIALTQWSGVSALIEGVFIDTPAGLFEVAEACSGVKFLIAMLALGALTAHTCFSSWRRRIVFMAVAIALPILANGVRAWGTIYIAQSQGIEFAAGFDHIFYGWIFFAIVMAILLALSWRFFDRSPDDAFIDSAALEMNRAIAGLERFTTSTARALIGIAFLCLAFTGWSAAARNIAAELPDQVDLPDVAGWDRVDFSPPIWWEPRASGADHRLLGSYVNEDGAQVDVFAALYRAQEEGREAGSAGEGALMPDSDWRWHSPANDFGIGQSERLQAGRGHQRVTLTLYRHRDMLGGSVLRLKLSNIRDRLMFDPEPTVMLILSAEEGQDITAQIAISSFLQSTAPLEDWMDRLAQNP